MGWTVKYNRLGEIAASLPHHLEDGIDQSGQELADLLRPIVWKDTGVVLSTIKERGPGRLHATVWVGDHKGRGFYSRFLEWGTVKMRARPIVGPTALLFEPRYAQIMAQAVRTACT